MKRKNWILWIPLIVLIIGVLIPAELNAVVAPKNELASEVISSQNIKGDRLTKEQKKRTKAERKANRKAYRKAHKRLLIFIGVGFGMPLLAMLIPGIGILALIGILVGFHSLVSYFISNQKLRRTILITTYCCLLLYGLLYGAVAVISSIAEGLTFF